jgi:hypothetical protein
MDFILDPSLVLYLPLYERDGASFISRDLYGRSCTVTGTLWRPNGRYFDGTDDSINCGSDAVLPLGSSDRTVTVWFKPESTNSKFFGYGTYQQDEAFEFQFQATNKIAIIGHTNNYQGEKVLSVGEWHHFVAVVKGSNIKSYINTELDIDTTHSLNTTAGGNIYIGWGGGRQQ